jgi:hypothetical protein
MVRPQINNKNLNLIYFFNFKFFSNIDPNVVLLANFSQVVEGRAELVRQVLGVAVVESAVGRWNVEKPQLTQPRLRVSAALGNLQSEQY